MIEFSSFTLDNGLKVLINEDAQTSLVAVNLLYRVGARDEDPERTGFAHLFEHLMFGGSRHIPEFDRPLQMAGGENNAFTNNDFTNYYITLPRENVETAFWLESDRMLEPAFSEEGLEVQKHVVIEEFKQRYLNQPYGDVWLLLRPLAYKVHPYRWPTIGKEIRHIEEATLDEVKAFFFSHYAPNNAILSLSGNITPGEAEKMVSKWFGGIPARELVTKEIPPEPAHDKKEILHVERDVPADVIYMAWHMDARNSRGFYASDLISDILANGNSSRLYQRLVKERRLFSQIDAYVMGSHDPGLLVVSGTLMNGVGMEEAEEAIDDELQLLKKGDVTERELRKVKNRVESTWVFSQAQILNKAMNLAFFEFFNHAGAINEEMERYRRITPGDITAKAKELFRDNNLSVLYYHAKVSNDER
jgi:predicted Zn-dependent peptidase